MVNQSSRPFAWLTLRCGLIAFAEYANRRGNVAISSRDGANVRRCTLRQLAATPQIQFIAWTAC